MSKSKNKVAIEMEVEVAQLHVAARQAWRSWRGGQEPPSGPQCGQQIGAN